MIDETLARNWDAVSAYELDKREAKVLQLAADYATKVEQIQKDKRYSADHKAKQQRELTEATREAITKEITHVFGEWQPVAGVQGGRLWSSLEKAETAVRKARDESVDPIDPGRVANEIRRLDSVSLQWIRLQDAERWYENEADGPARRAFMDVGLALGHRLFPGNTGLGRLGAMLERDRAQAVTTPKLEAAEARLRAMRGSAAALHASAQRAMQSLPGWDATDKTPAARSLRGVSVRRSARDASKWDAPVDVSVTQRAPAVIMPEQVVFGNDADE